MVVIKFMGGGMVEMASGHVVGSEKIVNKLRWSVMEEIPGSWDVKSWWNERHELYVVRFLIKTFSIAEYWTARKIADKLGLVVQSFLVVPGDSKNVEVFFMFEVRG